MKARLSILGWVFLAALVQPLTGSANGEPVVLQLEIRGAIGPATSEYVTGGIEEAAERDAALVLIEMDTPGGLDSAMRDIIKAILASPVPVATYVSPSGSRAASAGTYILYASHVAAMAPATNLGAATPVQIGGGAAPKPPGQDKPDTEDEDTPAAEADESDSGSAMERKAVNDAVAYIRSLAQLRGRNAEWAEKAVRSAESLSADKALEENVIDYVVSSVPELLKVIHGQEVQVVDGREAIESESAVLEAHERDWRIKLLEVITDPNVAYLLMLVGIYGLIFEGYNPGAILPGVVGAICLLLALFAFQVLPVNYAGLALIALGVILMVAETFVPSFGALGLGGIAAFVFGSIILLDEDVPGFEVSRDLIFTISVIAGIALLTLLLMLVRVRNRHVVSGIEGMIGEIGESLADFSGQGEVFVHGERWQARSARPVQRGQSIRITGVDGLTLEIEPIQG